jgi:hypothetical protein
MGPQYTYSSPPAQQEITEAELEAMHPSHANFIPELHNATPEVNYKLAILNPAKDQLPGDFSGSGESMHTARSMHSSHAIFIPELQKATPEVDYKPANPNPAKDQLPDDFTGSRESMDATRWARSYEEAPRFFTNSPTNNASTRSAASPQAPTRPTEPFPLTAGDRHRSARGMPGFLVL